MVPIALVLGCPKEELDPTTVFSTNTYTVSSVLIIELTPILHCNLGQQSLINIILTNHVLNSSFKIYFLTLTAGRTKK